MSDVLTGRDGAVLTITLNRPDVFNAFNAALHLALRAALEEAADPEVRAVVITGAGRGFCAGQDVREFAALEGSLGDVLEETYHPNIRLIRGLAEAGHRGRQRPCGRRRAVARECVRRPHRIECGRIRPRVRRHRARARLRGVVVPPPPARVLAGVRVDVLEPQARRRGGARLGSRLGSRPGRGLRRARRRDRGDLGGAADARRRADEAAVRKRAHRKPRASSSRSRRSCRSRRSSPGTSPKESGRSWRSDLRASPAPDRSRPRAQGAPMSEQLPVTLTDTPARTPRSPRRHGRPAAEPLDGLLPDPARDPPLDLARDLGNRRLVRGTRSVGRRHLHGPGARRAARVHRLVPALPDPCIRLLRYRGRPVPLVQRSGRLPGRRRDRAAHEPEPAHRLLPAAARDPGLHRPVRARSGRRRS